MSATPKTIASEVKVVRSLRPRKYCRAIRAICQRVERNLEIIVLSSFPSTGTLIDRNTIELLTYLIGVALTFQAILINDLPIAQKDNPIRVGRNAWIVGNEDHSPAPIISGPA